MSKRTSNMLDFKAQEAALLNDVYHVVKMAEYNAHSAQSTLDNAKRLYVAALQVPDKVSATIERVINHRLPEGASEEEKIELIVQFVGNVLSCIDDK